MPSVKTHPVWQLFPAHLKENWSLKEASSNCSLLFLQEPWRWFQGSSFCACSTLQSLSFMDPGRYLDEVTVQWQLKLHHQIIKVVRVSSSYILSFIFHIFIHSTLKVISELWIQALFSSIKSGSLVAINKISLISLRASVAAPSVDIKSSF